MYNAHTSKAKYNKDYFMIKAINIINTKISMVRHDSFKVVDFSYAAFPHAQ